MKIAVTYENGMVFQHFGHTKQFKIYDVEEGKIVKTEIADTQGSGHGALAGFLTGIGVEALICGGIGGGARTALTDANIALYPGVSGEADDSVKAFLSGTLNFNPDTACNHHHEHGHHCNEDKHGCSSN